MEAQAATGNRLDNRRTRTRLAPDTRREQVLEAATRMFERHPYDRLTTVVLAGGCGVSEGLLFHYFGSKRGLYVACLKRRIADFLTSIDDPGPEVPLAERLRHALDSYLDFVETYPRSYAAVLRGGIGMDRQVHELTEQARQRCCELIVRGLGIEEPDPRFRVAVWGWMGFVEAACTRWLAKREVPREELRELLLEIALASFGRLVASQG
jgi:AcrR family transcriptional regulator